MKQFRFVIIMIAASLALSFTSCNHRDLDDTEIDTESIKMELTDAIRTVYGKSVTDSLETTTTVVVDSVLSATAPVINVYVDVPSKSGGSMEQFDDGDFIAALAIVMVFAMPCLTFLLIIVAVLVFVYKRNRSRNAVIEQAIQAGYPLPESFYNGRQRVSRAKDTELLQSAIKLIGVGALLCISFMVVFDSPFVGLMCLIPAVIGIGRLIAYFVAGKDNDSNNTTGSNND